jgi:hypothetical protein
MLFAIIQSAKSPTTLKREARKEASELHIEEKYQNMLNKAKLDERKREHDTKIRNERLSTVQQMGIGGGGFGFSVDNGGSFHVSQFWMHAFVV